MDTGQCDRNHVGTSAAMEPVRAVNIFSRSEEKYGLRCVDVLGDGDSKPYTTLKNEHIYENVTIAKFRCCRYAQKRMGRQLTKKMN